MATYGDGVGDIDVAALAAFRSTRARSATVTSVTPPGRFGNIRGRRTARHRFNEKPDAGGGSINGGFFVSSANSSTSSTDMAT